MTLDVQITPVGLPHAAVVAALHAASFLPDEQWHEAAMQELLTSYGAECGLAMLDGKPAGFIMIRCVAGEAEVLTLCVAPNFQNRGVGAKLVAWAIQQAQNAQSDVLFLEVSLRNKSALKLYEKCGFLKNGLRKDYYPDGSDAFVMVFKINEDACYLTMA